MINCGVYNTQGDFKFWLTVVYVLNKLEQRKFLKKVLSKLMLQSPQCITGDFNNVIKTKDRIGGKIIIEPEYRDMQEMMDVKGLSKLDSADDYYTWSNKHCIGIIYS